MNNDNGVRLVKSTKFPQCNIHTNTWTSPDEKTHNQIDHIRIDRRRQFDVRSFRAADWDNDHYLVVAKVRERLAVNKQGSHRFHTNRKVLRIFGPRRDEVTGEWRKLHNKESCDLYYSPNIIRIIKVRRVRWAGHLARMGRRGTQIRLLVRKPE
jgi:hypothetical protein